MLCGQPVWEGVWGSKGTCIYMAESFPSSPEIITTFFVNWLYPNTKLKVFFKKTNPLLLVHKSILKNILERSGGVAPTWEDLDFLWAWLLCVCSSSGRWE